MKPTRTQIAAAAFTVALLGAVTAGVVAHAGSSAKTVTVTEKEFKIGLSSKRVPAGAVTFLVRNTGKLTHALAVSGPGVKTKRTPMIKPGKTAKLSVTVKVGSYTLWCPVPGHAARGMKTTLTVPGAAPVASTTSPMTTSSGGDGGAAWG